MKRLLVVPVIILLALVGYIFFIYDPNPPKKSTSQAAVKQLEPGNGDSTESEAATAADAVEFKVVPVTLPPQEQLTETAAEDEEQDDIAANAADLAADAMVAHSGMDNPDGAQLQGDAAAGEMIPDPAESAVAAESAAGKSGVDESAETADAGDQDQWAAAGSTQADQELAASAAAEEDVLAAGASSAAGSDEWQSLAAVDAAAPTNALSDTPAATEDDSADEELNPADFIEHKIVIHSSLYQAASDAGLTANQTARVQKIFKPHLDSRRELRDGDMLTVYLDPGASKASNDADQIHRLEFRGAKKTLIVTRRDDSMSDYEVRDGDGAMLGQEVSQASLITAEPKAAAAVSGNMQRIEAVVNVSFFSAAREAGLTPKQIDRLSEIMSPHIDFTREVRKGDRIVVLLDENGEIYSCEYIGAVKQLQVTRSGSGDYRVTDMAGRELTIAKSGHGASREQQPSKQPAAERITAAAEPLKNAPESRREESPKSAAAKPGVAAAKGAATAAKTVPGQPASKQARTPADNSGSSDAGTKGTFWERLSFGSSKAGPNWRPKDRNLAKVFDKVAASGMIERKALRQAFRYYESNRKASRLAQTHIAIADYTKKATTERLHIINLNTAKITSVQVAHGRNSGPIGGRVTSTSNANGSNKTTKGFYKVGIKEGRTSSKGYPYLPVQGLEPHNRLVGLPPSRGGRDIIIHTAGYVASGGRSLGCFSIRPEDKQVVFNKLKGVLFYSYVG
jgi:hypothetical protein